MKSATAIAPSTKPKKRSAAAAHGGGGGLGSLPGPLLRRILLAAGHNHALLAAVYARRCSPRVLVVGDGDFSFARALARIRARRGILCKHQYHRTHRRMERCDQTSDQVSDQRGVHRARDANKVVGAGSRKRGGDGGGGGGDGDDDDDDEGGGSGGCGEGSAAAAAAAPAPAAAAAAAASPVLCATSYDSRAALEMKYGVSAVGATLGQLSADVGVRVVHGVDATAMDAGAIGDGYDLIVFNFPKVDATTREEFRIAGRVPRNRYLIAGFLVSAARLLNEKTGTILIAQKMGHPYRCWTCTQAVGWAAEVDALRRRRCGAEGGGVDTVRRLAYGFNMPFVQGIFPGYKCANVSPEDGGRRRKGFSVKGADGSATAQLHVFSMLPQPAPCNNNNGCSTEGGEVPPQEGGDGALRCATCDIAFASESDLKSHLSGKRHRLNARNTGEWSRYLEYLETSSTSAESSSSSSCSSSRDT